MSWPTYLKLLFPDRLLAPVGLGFARGGCPLHVFTRRYRFSKEESVLKYRAGHDA